MKCVVDRVSRRILRRPKFIRVNDKQECVELFYLVSVVHVVRKILYSFNQDCILLKWPTFLLLYVFRFNYPSPNSDHAAFVYRLGCPVLWPRYVDNVRPPQTYVYCNTINIHCVCQSRLTYYMSWITTRHEWLNSIYKIICNLSTIHDSWFLCLFYLRYVLPICRWLLLATN